MADEDARELARIVVATPADDEAWSTLVRSCARDRVATPLEAAVLARRPEIVQLLMHEGAAMDERSWRHLHCVAAEIGQDDVIKGIDAYRPATAAAVSCTQ